MSSYAPWHRACDLNGLLKAADSIVYDATIALSLNRPEIEVAIRNGLMRFKDGGHPDHWEAHYRRQVTISGTAFLHLGIGKRRDYGAFGAAAAGA